MSAVDEDRHLKLKSAALPRRASDADVGALARLFAAAFAGDPVMDWISRRGPKRAAGLERFFYWVLKQRAVPFGHVWMMEDCSAAAAWLPPDAPASPGGFVEQLMLMPM